MSRHLRPVCLVATVTHDVQAPVYRGTTPPLVKAHHILEPGIAEELCGAHPSAVG